MTTVAVVWGTHPNEKHALKIGRSLASNSIPNVHTIRANKKAIRLGERLTEKNMAYAYPGSPTSSCYEERQAARVMRRLRELKPDVACDIHSIVGGEMHAVLNPAQGVAPWVLGALWNLGVRRILTNTANVHSHYPNAFGLEVASKDVAQHGIGFVRDFLDNLANNPKLPRSEADIFEWFEYTEPAGLHQSVIHPDDFTDEERRLYGSFKPLPPRIQQLLGVDELLYSQSDLHRPNKQGFYTDLFRRREAPDTSNWPR